MSTAPLDIRIDSKEVPTATKRLDALRVVGKKVEEQATKASKEVKAASKVIKDVGGVASTASGKVKKLSSSLQTASKGGSSATKNLAKLSKGATGLLKSLGPAGVIVDKTAKGLSAFAVAALAASAAAAAMAKEITIMAQRANTDTTTFQEWSYAVAKVGQDQQDLSDVLQDVNDKLADFRETGAGELVDFFENIAPKVGITADAFRDLSGPDALLLYYDSLEKAGLSQQEMTFYMESLASESTRMIPLLQNNATELRALTAEARDFNVAVNEIELKRLQDVGGEFTKVKNLIKGELLSAVAQFDEEIMWVLDKVAKAVVALGDGFDRLMDSFRGGANKRSLIGVEAAIKDIMEEKIELEERLGKLEGKNTRRAIQQRRNARRELDELKKQYDVLIDRKKELMAPENERATRKSKTANTVDDVRATNPEASTTPTGETAAQRRAREAKEKADKAAAAAAARAAQQQARLQQRIAASAEAARQAEAERQAEAYRREEEQLRESRGEQYQTLLDSLKSEEELVAESYRKRNEIILLNTEEGSQRRQELQRKLAEQFAEEALDGYGSESNEDRLEAEMAKINEDFEARRALILENTAITEEQRTALELELAQRRNDMLAAMEKQKTEATVNATGDMFANLATATKAYAGEQSKEYKAMFAVSRAFSIAQTTMKTYEAAQGAYSAMASIPYVGPFLGAAAAAAAVAAGMASVASVKSTSFAGAFDKGGDIPAGKIGLVGEYGPELVEGPMTVTSRKETAKMFREGASGSGEAPQAQPNNVRIINTVDPSVMGDYLGSDAGEEVILNVIRNNGSQIQQIVGG